MWVHESSRATPWSPRAVFLIKDHQVLSKTKKPRWAVSEDGPMHMFSIRFPHAVLGDGGTCREGQRAYMNSQKPLMSGSMLSL